MLEHGTPIERSFYIAIGHDEEGRGLDGAAEIARYMTGRGLNDVEFILDEGPYIFRNALPGLSSRDVAMIGVAEKGLVNMRLTVNGTVGHSSLPPRETAIVKLARAVSKLHANSHPNQFGQGPERDMVEAMAPYASLPYRILYSNLWLFSPLVARLLEADKLMNSFIRTTTAVTIFQSGIKVSGISAVLIIIGLFWLLYQNPIVQKKPSLLTYTIHFISLTLPLYQSTTG